MPVSNIAATNRPIGAFKDLPLNLSGRTFASIKELKTTLGKAHGILPPGQSVTVTIGQAAPGGRTPQLVGFNKSSPFTSNVSNGSLTITAKPTAKIGTVDRLAILQQPLLAPGNQGKGTKTSFTLEVGIGRIQIG